MERHRIPIPAPYLTPLLAACGSGHVGIVRLLLARCPNINLNHTLTAAAVYGNGSEELFQALLDKHALVRDAFAQDILPSLSALPGGGSILRL